MHKVKCLGKPRIVIERTISRSRRDMPDLHRSIYVEQAALNCAGVTFGVWIAMPEEDAPDNGVTGAGAQSSLAAAARSMWTGHRPKHRSWTEVMTALRLAGDQIQLSQNIVTALAAIATAFASVVVAVVFM